MKQLFVIIFLIFGTKISNAQAIEIPERIKEAFEGVWQYKDKFHTNTVKIQFEQGKDYALFTDIGTGIAPSKTFNMQLRGNVLVLPAVRNENDHLEMVIIKGKLHLWTIPVEWDANGKLSSHDTTRQQPRIFRRVKNTPLTSQFSNGIYRRRAVK